MVTKTQRESERVGYKNTEREIGLQKQNCTGYKNGYKDTERLRESGLQKRTEIGYKSGYKIKFPLLSIQEVGQQSYLQKPIFDEPHADKWLLLLLLFDWQGLQNHS